MTIDELLNSLPVHTEVTFHRGVWSREANTTIGDANRVAVDMPVRNKRGKYLDNVHVWKEGADLEMMVRTAVDEAYVNAAAYLEKGRQP